jgi:DNA-binding NarL/FixJ family response regulator
MPDASRRIAAHARLVRILLADDDPKVRSALRLLLENEPGIIIVGECPAVNVLIAQVASTRAEMVLVDWDLPNLLASGAVDDLRAMHDACQFMALSGRPEERDDALRAGAVKFVCKGDPPECLLAALHDVRPGINGSCLAG